MDQRQTVVEKIEADHKEFRGAARMWSGVYHTFQFGAAILSAVAALVLKLDGVGSLQARSTWGAALAAAVAIFIALLITGRFNGKWEANRVAAFAVRDLGYEIETTEANPDKILTELRQIGLTRNNAIVGLPTEIKSKP